VTWRRQPSFWARFGASHRNARVVEIVSSNTHANRANRYEGNELTLRVHSQPCPVHTGPPQPGQYGSEDRTLRNRIPYHLANDTHSKAVLDRKPQNQSQSEKLPPHFSLMNALVAVSAKPYQLEQEFCEDVRVAEVMNFSGRTLVAALTQPATPLQHFLSLCLPGVRPTILLVLNVETLISLSLNSNVSLDYRFSLVRSRFPFSFAQANILIRGSMSNSNLTYATADSFTAIETLISILNATAI
jgi:hypothetical protein